MSAPSIGRSCAGRQSATSPESSPTTAKVDENGGLSAPGAPRRGATAAPLRSARATNVAMRRTSDRRSADDLLHRLPQRRGNVAVAGVEAVRLVRLAAATA